MSEITNTETDTALLLENELKRRVKEVTRAEMAAVVHEVIAEKFNAKKAEIMTEIMLAVGKALHMIDKEERRPLWEAKPEDFNLTAKDMETQDDYQLNKELWRS